MFTRILYPTDFSDCSEKALEYVKKLKEAGTREVIVFHVIGERDIRTVSGSIVDLLRNNTPPTRIGNVLVQDS